MMVSVPFGISSLVGWAHRPSCHWQERESVAAVAREAGRQREAALAAEREVRAHREAAASAWQLAKQAETAAVNNDCATAASLGDQIRGLDETTYRCEYEPNAAVAACENRAPPAALDGALITCGLDGVRDQMRLCKQHTRDATVRVDVRVDPDGHVAGVSTSNDQQATCFANAIRSARFPHTPDGGSFSLPVSF